MHSWMRLLAGILPLLRLLHCEIIVDRPDSNYKVLCLVEFCSISIFVMSMSFRAHVPSGQCHKLHTAICNLQELVSLLL